MKKTTRRKVNILLSVVLMTSFCASNYAAQQVKKSAMSSRLVTQVLPKSIKKLIKKQGIPEKDLSIYVKDLNASKPLIALNIKKMRNPASTMKLLTTYSALKVLKPNYHWKTEAWIRGKLENGVLQGDLILKGYGDPFLVHQNYWKFIQGIQDRGLKVIQGDVIIDNSYFDLPPMDSGAFDHRPYRTYNAIPSALMYNFQASRFFFRPDKLNKKIDIVPYPMVTEFNYVNKVKYTSGRCRRSHYLPSFSKKGKTIIISGSYSEKCGQQYILRALSDPAHHAFNGFRDFWTGMGGKLQGGFRRGIVQPGDRKLHTYFSASLGDQIRVINKWSNNVMTRELMLTLGAKKYGKPATLEKGRKAIMQTLAENGIDSNGVIIDNGSGLSRIARINASQHAQLLEHAWRDEFMPEFMSSLSLSGLDGTLVNRFRDDAMQGRTHMKTGTLKNAKSIAGYMLSRKGKWLVVVMHQNGPKVSGGRGTRLQNAVLRWVFEQ